MRGIAMKFAVFIFIASSAVGISSAQVPAAPLPAQIFSAKTVFISNTSGRSAVYPGISELTYNEFYAAMKAWGRYQLVAAPTDADLVFEIRYATALGPTNGGNSGQYAEFELTIFDTKTHVVLWAVSETVVPIKHKSDQESLEQALANVVADAKKLVDSRSK
jgi:hypothetical protein